MNVKYEYKSAMIFIGFSTSISPEEGYIKCPEFWDKEYSQKYSRLWQTMKPETQDEKAIFENGIGMFAICDEKDGFFEYWIAGLYKGGEVPDGFKLYTFPESEWAMFSTKGPLPNSLQELNTKVWQEWYPNEGQKYMGNGNAMLEVYSAGNMQSPDYECGIWVPICRTKVN
ncbi:GyrI-like domain-containing protein [Bullifex porci]|uniref:GyrI-like domain-containing protein n=1 Tax=Bullifex porci TaxID=2606638 RepID=UPI0023F17154|nr:GyrI-like domain-containing protein [Bullifex porci]MDD7589204.1 GyrI-like domain-containing protein [Bullifex porci]